MAIFQTQRQVRANRVMPQRFSSGQPLDPGLRRIIYGPIQSMDEDREQSFWQWLFHRG